MANDQSQYTLGDAREDHKAAFRAINDEHSQVSRAFQIAVAEASQVGEAIRRAMLAVSHSWAVGLLVAQHRGRQRRERERRLRRHEAGRMGASVMVISAPAPRSHA